LSRLEAAGIPLLDAHDAPEYIGFRIQDTDGYWIEAYHEPRT
jgi:hypothetical protein